MSKLRVCVLPDFFLDRIVFVPSLQDLFTKIKRKAALGGGSLRGFKQIEVKGGNATNLAFALSSLSVKTNLYIVGDRLAKAITAACPEKCSIRLIDGRPGYTVALEFPYRGTRVNVMLSDVGDLLDFSGEGLTRRDISTLSGSDCIALVNWAANSRGTELAAMVFNLGAKNDRMNFLDPADLLGAEERFREFSKRIISEGLMDVLSLNENEARILARLLKLRKPPLSYNADSIRRLARSLHEALSVTIDIHTRIGSASSTSEETAWAESFGEIAGPITGAGDAWDAGDIAGHLLKLENVKRLKLANACAYLYIAENATPPTLSEVTEFLEKKKITLR